PATSTPAGTSGSGFLPNDAASPRWLLPAAALAMLPWISPWASGPSTPAWRWMVSAACGVLLWTLAAWRAAAPAVPRGLAWACAALAAWAVLSGGPVRPEDAMLAAGLVLIVIAATAARDP